MISADIQHAVVPVVQNLLEAGLMAIAKPNTPVGMLLSTVTHRSVTDSATGVTTFSVVPLEGLGMDGAENCEAQVEAVAAGIATKLSGHLNFARNVVAPMVGEFAEKAIPYIESDLRSEIGMVEVIPVKLPALARMAELEVDRFDVNRTINLQSLQHDNPRTDAEVLELMLVGKANVDAEIHAFAQTLPAGALSSIWDTFFSNRERAERDRSMTTGELFADGAYGLTRSLVVYLVATKLSEKAESDCNAPLEVYRSLALDLRNQSGNHVAVHKNRYNAEIETDQLIQGIVRPKIYVNGDVFQQFLLNGGSVDLLLGMQMVKGDKYDVKSATILENREKYDEAWRVYMVKKTQEADANRHLATVRVLNNSFPGYLATVSEEIAPLTTRAQIVNRFQTRLRQKSLAETEDIYQLVLELFCWSLFDHTDAYTILSLVGRAGRANPNATPAECAAIANIEYLATFLASCSTVVKIQSN